MRCGYRAQIARASSHGGFLQMTGTGDQTLIICWNGRDCGLRFRRRRLK